MVTRLVDRMKVIDEEKRPPAWLKRPMAEQLAEPSTWDDGALHQWGDPNGLNALALKRALADTKRIDAAWLLALAESNGASCPGRRTSQARPSSRFVRWRRGTTLASCACW